MKRWEGDESFRMKKMNESCQSEGMNVLSMDEDRPMLNESSTPFFINSEYVSELLM